MKEIILFIIFIPLIVFWIVLKILRIKLYAYEKINYPEEYKHFGYHAMGFKYLSKQLA